MNAKYLGIPVIIASALFMSACTGDNKAPEVLPTQAAVSPSSAPNGIAATPYQGKKVDPNDPNQGRNLDPVPKSDFTPEPGSKYDMSTSGKGVDKEKDAGDPNTATEVDAPINSGGMGTMAGMAINYNGSKFAPSTPVSIKILTVSGEDTGVEVAPTTTDAKGDLNARVYLPKNLQSGTYEITFSGAGDVQKTKVDIIAGQ